MSAGSTLLAGRARALEDHRQPVEARLGQERGACPRRRSRRRRGWRGGRGWSPSGVIESLTCSEPRRSQADDRVEVVEHARRAPRRCGCRSPRPAGGRSPGRRRAACRRPRPRSAPRAPRTSARACRRRPRCPRGAAGTLSDSASASRITSPARSIAFSTEPPFLSAEPGCSTTPTRAQRGAGVERARSAPPATCRGSPGPRRRS